MNRLLLFSFLIITQIGNAQYAKFRIDFHTATINGRSFTFNNPIIQNDINDSSDIQIIGYNLDNEKMGVQFHLIKVLTKDSSYYLACVNFIYMNNSGEIKNVPIPEPDYDHPLTKSNKSFKLKNRSYKYTPIDKSLENPYEISYTFSIDGNSLDYNEKLSTSNKTKVKVEVNLKLLAMKDSFIILKNKLLNLKETSKEEQIKIGTYLNHPVILKYRITSGKIGSLNNICFNSTLSYTNENGKEESSFFINTNSTDNKMHIIKVLDIDYKTGVNKLLMYCEYEVSFGK